MKKIALALLTATLLAPRAGAIVGEDKAELVRRHGPPIESPLAETGSGRHIWRDGLKTRIAKMENYKCVEEELAGADERTVTDTMRAYAKNGKLWTGNAAFLGPGETRTLKLQDKQNKNEVTHTVTITRDVRKPIFTATFKNK